MGVGAYLLWGFLPIYWHLMRAAGPLETLAHRIVWSLAFVGALLVSRRGVHEIWTLGARRLRLLGAAAVLVGVNWGLYIWGVNSGRVVETALGYFINPLFTILLGVIALRERLRRAQWLAIGLAGVAVVVLTVNYGHPPWLALALAATFALYGFIKKQAGVSAILGLAIETSILFVPAVAYLATRPGAFGHDLGVSLLLMSTGIVTSVPLMLFAAAANRIPLTLLGPLQYLSPTLQFLCGVLVFHEEMPPVRWLGFILVWTALVLFVLEGLFVRRQVLARQEASTVDAALHGGAGQAEPRRDLVDG